MLCMTQVMLREKSVGSKNCSITFAVIAIWSTWCNQQVDPHLQMDNCSMKIIMPKSALKLQVGTQAFCTLTLFKCSNVGLIGTFLCNHPMATTPLDIQHKLEPFMASTPLRKSLLSPPPGVPPDCWNIKRGKIFTAPFSS